MITELKIENYKSIQDLTLEVGRVNVLIGENGCGKSNILEAITLAAAAEANKLDNEFLANRGIRITEPELMRSIFNKKEQTEPVKINFITPDYETKYSLCNDNNPYSEWTYFNETVDDYHVEQFPNALTDGKLAVGYREFKKFIIYSPENTTLRDFSKKANIEPLGYRGEGLFKLLTVIQNEANQSQNFTELDDIQETLALFGWFESVEIPDDYTQLDRKITIQDRYLEIPFDQRSANEGFLLVLFYITLVVSKYTPKIFAIDNLDTSLNPKLCTKLIKELTRLAKKYDKQMFITTHNPAILDGIDLGDDEQRLFVVSRNKEGHTRCKRIEVKDKPKSSVRDRLSRVFEDNKTYTKEDILNQFDNSDEPVKLSYAFLRGYLGGLPKNF